MASSLDVLLQGEPTLTTKPHKMLPALPKAAFDQAYHSWATRRDFGRARDGAFAVHEGRVYIVFTGHEPVHLHLLHAEILSAASQATIVNIAQWQAIAGRLGLADRNASQSTGVSMSTAEVATQLRLFYQKYLQDFDNIYLGSVLASMPRRTLVVHPEDIQGDSNVRAR